MGKSGPRDQNIVRSNWPSPVLQNRKCLRRRLGGSLVIRQHAGGIGQRAGARSCFLINSASSERHSSECDTLLSKHPALLPCANAPNRGHGPDTARLITFTNQLNTSQYPEIANWKLKIATSGPVSIQ